MQQCIPSEEQVDHSIEDSPAEPTETNEDVLNLPVEGLSISQLA